MFEIKLIKADSIMPAVEELLNAGSRVRITVTGMSMYPFLRGNKDLVELIKTGFAEVKKGDILLVVRDNRQYVLHRIIKKKKDSLYINGDAQQWCEGPIRPEQIVAKVIMVWRQDRGIPCNGKIWRMLSCLWYVLFPFRYFIINFYRRMRRILFHINNQY